MRLKTGVPGLDEVLGGGFFEGGIYVVQGAPGTGKTILANHICHAEAARGGRSLYLTLLSEPHDRLLRYLDELAFTDLSHVPDRIYYVSGYAELRDCGLEGICSLIRKELHREAVKLLLLDGLWVAQERVQQASEFREFVHELQGLAASTGCTMLFLTNGPTPQFSPEQTMVDGIVELNRDVFGVRPARSLVVHKLRGTAFLEGRHFFRITSEGISLFPRLEATVVSPTTRLASSTQLSTGLAELDKMMRGGIPARSTTLLAGPSGSGKTTMGLTFLGQSSDEEPGLLFGCYESPDELAQKARSIGLDTDRLLASGALTFEWHRPFETNLDEMAYHLIGAAERTGARRIFVDGVGAFHLASIYPERLTAFFTALSIRLRQCGATLLCSAEARELFQPEDLVLAEISPVAENMILLRFAHSERALRRTLSIIKIRQSGFDENVAPFDITSQGIVLQIAPGITDEAS